MKAPPFLIVLACFASLALADDFKTIDGKEYKNVTVSRQEPRGVTVTKPGMIVILYFDELPKEVQERFHYDPGECEKYRAEQQQWAEQQNEEQRRRGEENQRNKAKEWEGLENAVKQRKTMEQLEAQISRLKGEKNYLEHKIAEKESLPENLSEPTRTRTVPNGGGYVRGRRFYYPNPAARADLPALKGRLDEVKDELQEAAKQLQQIKQVQPTPKFHPL
jgi:hypothetical protein